MTHPPGMRGFRWPPMPREDVLVILKLVQQFDPYLRTLGTNVSEVRKLLNARLSHTGTGDK